MPGRLKQKKIPDSRQRPVSPKIGPALVQLFVVFGLFQCGEKGVRGAPSTTPHEKLPAREKGVVERGRGGRYCGRPASKTPPPPARIGPLVTLGRPCDNPNFAANLAKQSKRRRDLCRTSLGDAGEGPELRKPTTSGRPQNRLSWHSMSPPFPTWVAVRRRWVATLLTSRARDRGLQNIHSPRAMQCYGYSKNLLYGNTPATSCCRGRPEPHRPSAALLGPELDLAPQCLTARCNAVTPCPSSEQIDL